MVAAAQQGATPSGNFGRVVKVRRVLKATHSLMASAGALLIGGCGSGHSTPSTSQPKIPASTPALLGSLVGRPQGAVLRLTAGRSSAHFVITAVAHDTWDMQVSAPSSANFAVDALKADGERLHLLETTHQPETCATAGPRVHCFLRFAVGANQTAETWTVIAKKRTGPATTIRIQIMFYSP